MNRPRVGGYGGIGNAGYAGSCCAGFIAWFCIRIGLEGDLILDGDKTFAFL